MNENILFYVWILGLLSFVVFVAVYTRKELANFFGLSKQEVNGKESIFSCKWFSLVKDGHYYYIDYGVEHSGVVIVPIVDNSHILFVKNYRYPLKQDSWELPRGFIDKGENFTQAALRELVEETAYEAKTEQCEQLGFVAPDSSILHNSLPIILVHLKSSDQTQKALDPEISQVEKVELKNLKEWLKTNNVIDGISLASLMKYNNK